MKWLFDKIDYSNNKMRNSEFKVNNIKMGRLLIKIRVLLTSIFKKFLINLFARNVKM